MATIKIYSDIVDEETAQFMQMFGLNGVSFDTVDQFIDSIPADDNEINLKINSRGGDLNQALTMYDALRATGKEISAEVIGQASSAATVLLCAAKKENRTCTPNAKFLFHYPYIAGEVVARAEDLQNMADDLRHSEQDILNLYVERTGCDREEMDALMKEDKVVSAERAKELGFITTILAPKSAKHIDKKSKSMKVKEALTTIARSLGLSSTYAMELETADGRVLELEKEEGEPQVGDKVVSEDGEYLMPDGSVIVVEGGEIKSINPPVDESEEPAKEEEKPAENEPATEAAAEEEKPAEEEAEPAKEEEAPADDVEELKKENDELKAKVAELEAELEAAKAGEKTVEDKAVLNAVKMAGGIDALKRVSSDFVVNNKQDFNDTKKAPENAIKMSYREFYNLHHNK